MPLTLDAAAGVLRGHVARANPVWRAADGQPVLAVFRGAEGYVSPSWYPSKAVHHQVVPTWNYAVVHAHGRLRVVGDAAWLRALVGGLTDHHESPLPAPWAIDDAPGDYVQRMLRAIVGIEIPIERLAGKFELGQNRSAEDRAGVVRGLAQRTAAAGGDAGADPGAADAAARAAGALARAMREDGAGAA